MPKRVDPFLLLTAAGRRRREQADLDFLSRATAADQHAGTAESIAVRDRVAALRPDLDLPKPRLHRPGDPITFAICARVDLDHPIYFSDNLFTQCADCGCDLQYRPDTPAGDRVCICCAAERVREPGSG